MTRQFGERRPGQMQHFARRIIDVIMATQVARIMEGHIGTCRWIALELTCLVKFVDQLRVMDHFVVTAERGIFIL